MPGLSPVLPRAVLNWCVTWCVGYSVAGVCYLKGVRHCQTNDARAQGVSPHHGENGSSQDHAVANELQVDRQPSVDGCDTVLTMGPFHAQKWW